MMTGLRYDSQYNVTGLDDRPCEAAARARSRRTVLCLSHTDGQRRGTLVLMCTVVNDLAAHNGGFDLCSEHVVRRAMAEVMPEDNDIGLFPGLERSESI